MNNITRILELLDAVATAVKDVPEYARDIKAMALSIERAIVQRPWTFTVFGNQCAKAEQLATEFVSTWDGTKDAWGTFVVEFKACFGAT